MLYKEIPSNPICEFDGILLFVREKALFQCLREKSPSFSFYANFVLDNTLRHHGLSHLHETGDVCTLHVVDVTIFFGTVLHAIFVDVLHDVVKLAVHFFGTPRNTF